MDRIYIYIYDIYSILLSEPPPSPAHAAPSRAVRRNGPLCGRSPRPLLPTRTPSKLQPLPLACERRRV